METHNEGGFRPRVFRTFGTILQYVRFPVCTEKYSFCTYISKGQDEDLEQEQVLVQVATKPGKAYE
jgi:hypothetical protein